MVKDAIESWWPAICYLWLKKIVYYWSQNISVTEGSIMTTNCACNKDKCNCDDQVSIILLIIHHIAQHLGIAPHIPYSTSHNL